MAISIDELTNQVKQANRIEDVIAEESGFTLEGHGRYLTTREHDSLVVDTHNQAYFWNSNGEHGDVIAWVQKRKGIDYKAAMELLCRRVGMKPPEWKAEDPAVRMAARAREDALEVAAAVFSAWLWDNEEALKYARGRGWSNETITEARIGYTGDQERKADLINRMRNEFGRNGVDPRSPAAVAILGMKGEVRQWSHDYQLPMSKELEGWIEKNYIPGIIGRERLVYTHIIAGRVAYLSLRGIKEKSHYNLPASLVGERQLYLNARWSSLESYCVIVEGQADAISLQQMDIAAVALNGVAADDKIAHFLGAKREDIARRPIFYLGLDADKAGNLAQWKIARLLGPLSRLVEWHGTSNIKTFISADGVQKEVKDANDLLLGMNQAGIDAKTMGQVVGAKLNNSPTFAERLAVWVGNQDGANRNEAMKEACEVFAKMGEVDFSQYSSLLAKTMGCNQRDLKGMIKASKNQASKGHGEGEEVVYTLGGSIKGWLLEYLYDRSEHRASLCWRDPNGKIDSGFEVVIEGVKYRPENPGEEYRERAVMWPSALGESKSTRELAKIIELYINSVYILPNPLTGKIISYWTLMTWVYDCFDALPYLRATGASGAGKSELMYRVGLCCYRMMTGGGADTVSTLFRGVERWRGTVFMDEADLKESDASDERVKFLNFGAMKGHPIWRTEEMVGPDGRRTYVNKSYRTYCPKLIAMRRDFRDDAVGNRSITFRIQEHGMRELLLRKIPLHVTEEIHEKTQYIRNLLVRWRLEHWKPEIEVKDEYYEVDISARLNQVTGAMMMVAEDDPELQADMRQFLREYYAELTQSKSMTIVARVLEAMWKIYKYPDLHKEMVMLEGGEDEKILVGSITKIANSIIDEENSDGSNSEDGATKMRRNELSPHKIGRLLRDDMQLEISKRKTNKGFAVYWNQTRMEELSRQYGIDPEDIAKDAPKPAAKQMEIGGGEG